MSDFMPALALHNAMTIPEMKAKPNLVLLLEVSRTICSWIMSIAAAGKTTGAEER